MGYDRQKTRSQYAFKRLIQGVVTHAGHELHQHVFRAGERRHAAFGQKAAGHVRIEYLRAKKQAQIHACLTAGGMDLFQTLMKLLFVDLLDARRDVRGGDDRSRAAAVSPLRHFQRHLQALRAVVDAIEQMVMDVRKASHHRAFFAGADARTPLLPPDLDGVR